MGRLWLVGLGLMALASLVAGEGYVKLFERCSKEKNTFDCFKKKSLDILDGAIRDDSPLVVNDYISITKDANAAKKLEQQSLENATTSQSRSLDDMLEKKFNDYVTSRSIKLTIPGDVFEGRGKKDKKGGMGGIMMGGLALAGMMAQLAFGKIAFLAGTALLTAKIALVLSAIIGLKKLVGGGGGGGHEVIYATASEHHGGGYGGWQRALDAIPIT
ncbi:uncharacterized protein LOC106649238 [Trichogramma pretiosum]|uniref:uncharacterized protein LOC106649238 n=1 Tax=Trichogramma pretiosum TaxID=7493 RepID=UPI0006C97B21|nr:uncharacterized protein LOC106649238 [Trichogramma pretiosum]